eukprot:3751909-Ditylum_brightwellii.AAC.1
MINPTSLTLDKASERVEFKLDFGTQHSYFHEELDLRPPDPLTDNLDREIFCDANHGHGKATGRSITGIFSIVGLTPITWSLKQQACIQMSTFSADFTAPKKAV